MAQKNELYEQKVKHKGYFNFSELYNFCSDWLTDEGYKIAEKEYTEKLSNAGKEILIKWEASKKITDYLKFQINLDWHILGMKDAEIERDGVRESTNKGEVKITFKAILVKDYEDRWETKPIWKFLRGIYDRYIIRTTIDEYESKLVKKTKSFIADVKSFLQLEGK